MPTELVPREKKKKGVSLTPLRVLAYLLFGLVLAMTASFVVLKISTGRTKKELIKVEREISQQDLEAMKEVEEEILNFQYRLSTYRDLLDSHQHATLFFDFFEDSAHQRIFFNKLTLNTKEARASASGKATDFTELREQILVLREKEEVKEVSIKRVTLAQDGGLTFTLDLTLDPSILKK